MIRPGIGMAFGAGLLVLPYVLWNVIEFGTVLPVSGLVKERHNFNIVTSQMGGYLSIHALLHSLGRAFEKLLWVTSNSLGTLDSVLGLGRGSWLVSPALVATVLAGILTVLTAVCFAKRRISTASVMSGGEPAVIFLKRSFLVLLPFWAIWGAIDLSSEAGSSKLAARVLLTMGALLTAAVAWMCSSRKSHDADDKPAVKILAFFWVAIFLHAMSVVYALDYVLDYTTWYFANWFVVISLSIGAAIRHIDTILSRSMVRKAFRYSLAIWFSIGFLARGYRSVDFVTREPLPPMYGLDGMYAQAKWLEQNTPSTAVIASYNAGVIGYFSNRRTINLDGMTNSKDLMPYLFGPRSMTEYIDTIRPDYVADYITSLDWQKELSSAPVFRGIDRERLVPVNWITSQGGFPAPRTHVVFRVTRTDHSPKDST
ncbi:MAG: hypothetical protein QME66_02050 [Candidatus Eisenbacteria bacterium]|nr:hypothetical protein [Candidatus Eisenbacteria bacterium]